MADVLRGRAGLSPVMIGRHGPLARLTAMIDVAAVTGGGDEGPAVALVSGEPGIGKSRLLRELVESVPGEVKVYAARALPGSMGRAHDVANQFGGVGETMSGRALLIVEDLHWIDADSARVLEELVASSWYQLVVVGTYRPGELSRKSPGGELVLRLERQYAADQIRLERLDRGDVSLMLGAITGAVPPSAIVEAVYRRSGGIPLVVEELLRCAGPDLQLDDVRTAELPWSLRDAIRHQLPTLSAEERRVVDALAVFGDPAAFDLLAGVSELGDEVLLAALRSLADRDIVVEQNDDTFWFSHALTADAVHQQLLGRERRRLHQRSLDALRASATPDHAALARHALASGQYDLIVGIAREGARRYLDNGASFQALRLAGEALAEAPDDPELLAVATDAAWRLEFLAEALGHAEHWRASALTDLDRVESMRFIARLHHEAGHVEERARVTAELARMADELPPGMARGRCAGAVAQLYMLAYERRLAGEWALRALEEARRTGDEWLEAQATVEWASNLPTDDHTRNEADLLHALDLARRVGDGVLECRALNNLHGVVSPHSERGEWARRELRAAAQRTGLDKFGIGLVTLWDVGVALARGDMATMRRALRQTADYWDPASTEYGEVTGYTAMLHIEEGLVDEAVAAIGPDVADMTSNETLHRVRIVVVAAALRRDRAAASTALSPLASLDGVTDKARTVWLATEIGLAALMADVEPAVVRDLVAGRWAGEGPAGEFVRHHLEGPLRLAEGDPAGAIEALAPLLDPPDAEMYVPLRASLRTSLAVAQLAVSDRAAALATARLAADDLAKWPGWRRDRAEALIRRLDGAAVRGDGELTAREREVAALISEGLTNAQLAERLYISPKTAAVHVSNILAKLGLASRVEVAAWAVRHGTGVTPSRGV